MISFCKKSAYLACAAAAVLALSGCGADPTPSPTTIPQTEAVQETTIPKESIEHLTLVMKAGEIYTLDYYPNLKSVDLSGSTCYDTILEYIANHPQVDVTYSVDVGGSSISNKSTSATLEAGAFDYDLLMTNLQFLPNLSTLSLPNITLTSDQVGALLETYPQVSLDYTVTLFGQALGQDVTNLDLTTMTSDQVSEACQKLGLLTHLTDVELGENLTLEDVAKLQDAAERVTFHYSFTLFGQTLSTTDETVEYKNQNIGNEGEAEIRRALPVLDNCQRFILDNCGLDNEVLAGIREDFRDGPKVVWRVYYGVDGRYNLLTDADTLRAVYNVTDETCGPMRYCEDVKYMDIGHNETLTDLSFIGYMPNIEVVIASGCAVKELVGFEKIGRAHV